MRPSRLHATPRPTGFTLIELGIVILIIGILMAFVLAVSATSLEQARVRATQALIAKVSAAMEDRLDALLSLSITPNGAHRYLAAINPPGYTAGSTDLPWGLTSEQRAEVIARLDRIKAELPDVFYLDPTFNTASNQFFPINFCGLPYPATATTQAAYLTPLGHLNADPFLPKTYDSSGNALYYGVGDGLPNNTSANAIGINGASYAAAASLFQLIGYTPRGCDGVDNYPNTPDGLIDDYEEGTRNADGTKNAEAVAKVNTFLQNHQHKTARSEMLYAILVNGLGPLGSMFTREEFTDNEIRDTDQDGVPEFVDGWGEPIQFFRWPFFHRSGGEPVTSGSALNRPVLQKGDALYGLYETRQQNALDPNGQLVTLAWWARDVTASPIQPTDKCLLVQNYFGPLSDPYPAVGTGWDRSGQTARRAYFTKFLVLSAGPDREFGVGMLDDSAVRSVNTTIQRSQLFLGSITSSNSGVVLYPGESWAMARPVVDEDFSLDDISNQNLQNQAGGLQ